ncbi:MAG: efflux RND transporter periplasmic adaptor subunit [Betaproteobacteria bacterium]|nr:MAG: efflux RND transporter periplasmic adaptor subunit [Betaproteobacteria bacterium]
MYTSRGSLLALGALTSTLLLAACGSEPEVGNQAVKPVRTAAAPPKPMGLPVKAETVRVGAVIDEVTAVGSLLAEESVIIRPEIDGRIASLNFREGQSVKRGQRLLSLDSSEYEAQLAAVKAELRTEQQRHQRAKELHEQKFITKEALDVQAGAVDRLEARVKEAQVRVDKTVMRAPFSGIVGLREVSPGAYVKAGDDIVILENLDSIKVDFRIPEVYLAKVGREQLVTLRLDAFPDEEFEGRVYAVHPVVDEETRTVLLRARVENRGFRLKPGMFARVALTMSTRPNAITVPEQALWPQGRDNFVYKVVDGKAMLTKVELGNRRPGEVEIKQGLVPGDVVVTEGQIKLRDGAPVMVMGAPPASEQSTAQDGGSQSG